MDLSEFLLARVAEDHKRVDTAPEFEEEDSARGPGWGNRGECPICGHVMFSGTESVTEEEWWDHVEVYHQRSRVLAECEAKRRIVAQSRDYSPELSSGDNGEWAFDLVLRYLAQTYASHPDFDPAWRIS